MFIPKDRLRTSSDINCCTKARAQDLLLKKLDFVIITLSPRHLLSVTGEETA